MPFSGKKLHFLTVEDNTGDFLLIEDYIKDEITHSVIHHAKTFSEAKEYLNQDIHFDAILLDLSLPDASGEQLVKEMVRLSGSVPIIVLTGYTDKDFGVRTLSLGVSDYLLKDELDPSQLYKSIAYSIERKRISLQLEESEEKYRDLFHLSPLPMWVYDVGTYRFLNVNEAAVRHYGYSREEFLGMTIKDIRPEEDVNSIEATVNINKETGAFYQGTVRHHKKSGELIHVEIQSNLINFEGMKARLVLARDISERIKYIQAIEDQNMKMREIAWIQSHVVRAPLARIMTLIDMLKNYTTEEINTDELLNHILSSANELDNILRDIVRKTEEVENQHK